MKFYPQEILSLLKFWICRCDFIWGWSFRYPQLRRQTSDKIASSYPEADGYTVIVSEYFRSSVIFLFILGWDSWFLTACISLIIAPKVQRCPVQSSVGTSRNTIQYNEYNTIQYNTIQYNNFIWKRFRSVTILAYKTANSRMILQDTNNGMLYILNNIIISI